LPEPEYTRREWRAPRTPQEEILCSLFAETLGLDRVGIDDNFFELGGHSLALIILVSRIRAALDVDVPIRTFFEAACVKDIASELQTLKTNTRPALRRAASAN
jgi:acyl carrier protein